MHCELRIQLFSCDRRYNLSCSAVVSKFTKVYSLPSAEIQSAVGDWNSKAVADEGAFGVGWHIVVALESMLIIGLTFLHHAVEDALHVDADIWIGILVDSQSSRRMLDEKVEQSHFGQCWQMR